MHFGGSDRSHPNEQGGMRETSSFETFTALIAVSCTLIMNVNRYQSQDKDQGWPNICYKQLSMVSAMPVETPSRTLSATRSTINEYFERA